MKTHRQEKHIQNNGFLFRVHNEFLRHDNEKKTNTKK